MNREKVAWTISVLLIGVLAFQIPHGMAQRDNDYAFVRILGLDDIALAKAICAGCPLAEPCLEGAVDRREPWGVWGGQLFFNGKILPFKRKRGRPPKNAQAQLTA